MEMLNPRRSVLIVDDIPSNIQILGEILKDECRVIFATSGEDALFTARTQNPDLILLDIMMPGMDGYQVCALLKSDPQTREIPVIFVSALDKEQHEAVGLDLGAIDYIAKPINPRLVRLRVRNHLELKGLKDHYKDLSCLDGLTGIPNRRQFEEFLNREWRRCGRSGLPLSLIMMDVDQFKRYNDHYGHGAGDEVLTRIAAALTGSRRRPADFLARFGGEEFACVLPETDRRGAALMGRKLQERVTGLKIPHSYSDVADHLTLSLGGATAIPTREGGPQSLFEAADGNLYKAKAKGRNCLVG